MSLLYSNLIYVLYRLVISAPIVKFINRFVPFYLAVVIMAQLSFLYDNIIFKVYFGSAELPILLDYIIADATYTIRVLCAWWVIRQLWNYIGNYWVAVFIGAELTFVFDFLIFQNLYV